MPFYEFICPKCNEVFSLLTKNNIESCPKCNEVVHNHISITNFNFNTSSTNPLPPKKIKINENKISDKKIFTDLICEKCLTELNDEFIYLSKINEYKCPKCKNKMIQKLDKLHFKLTFNPKTDICDWSHNTSKYWNNVKEERRKGNKVKGLNEK